MSVTADTDFIPNFDQGGATWDQTNAVFGVTLERGGNCKLCGAATYCGGSQCPNLATLPLAPDGVPATAQAYTKVTVFNFITGAYQDQVA